MKATQVITGALVLGSVALGTVGLAPEAAAMSFLMPDGSTISDPNLERVWLADEAVSDGIYHNPNPIHNHAVWLPNLQGGGNLPNGDPVNKGTFVWKQNTYPVLYEYLNGTARLVGSVEALLDPSKQFDVDVWFKPTDPANPPSPKKELSGSAYSPSPSAPVNTNDWWYYEIDDSKSTLTGVGGTYDGWTLNLAEYSNTYSVQLGVGANGKNTNMGLAAWFGYTGSATNSGHADFNLDLKPLPEVDPHNDPVGVPEPATMSLLSLGLLGFGMGALKRKKA